MGCGTSFVKYVLFFFNLIFALVGLAMVGLGVAVLLHWTVLKDLIKDNFTVAPWLFIVVGAVVFVIAFFGCCGAIRESHCMVVTYAIFLLVIIIAQIALAVVMFVYEEPISEALTKSVDKLFEASKHDQVSKTTFQNIEIQLGCCGARSSNDYLAVNLPKHCCAGDSFLGICSPLPGCTDKVAQEYEKWNKPIAYVAIGVACAEVVGALFALCLANSIRNMDRRYA